MDSINNYVIGECKTKCPELEMRLRENQKLLHVLETVQGTEKTSFPKLDRNKAVKAFSRSAAGKKMLDPKSLRPPDVLVKTVYYLLNDVINNKRVPWNATYDFIMDRLRAVRQDMVIQNFTHAQSISILQPIIRFYAYCSYRMCTEDLKYYDPVLNSTHLQECLKRLLYMYDECDTPHLDTSEENVLFYEYLEESRPEFEALYILINLGNITAITRSLHLTKELRNHKTVKLATEISISYWNNNYIRVCRLIQTLPALLFAVSYTHMHQLRKKALYMMSVAYNSKNLTFPADKLKDLLLYDTIDDVIADCKHYGLECKEKCIYFVRNNFNDSQATVMPRHSEAVELKLSVMKLTDLLLTGH